VFPGTPGVPAASLATRLALETGQRKTLTQLKDQWLSPSDGLLYKTLWDRDGRKITYQWFRQRLQIEEGGEVRFKQGPVWGVKVSPDGRKVAFSTGLLERGKLYVRDGKTTHALGLGVHPTWSPDGRWLVYSRPTANDATPGPELKPDQLELIGADLYAVQLPEKRFIALTHTPHQLELEPAFSPGGGRIACAEWRSGRLLILPFGMGGQR